MLAVATSAKPNSANTDSHFWEPVMKAIIQVESGGDAKAISGSSCGAMQITPILVEECNNILKENGSKKSYKLSDRYSIEKSKEMFILFQSKFNSERNIEKAIRSWNGGPRYKQRSTQRYYNKVMAEMKK